MKHTVKIRRVITRSTIRAVVEAAVVRERRKCAMLDENMAQHAPVSIEPWLLEAAKAIRESPAEPNQINSKIT